MTLRRSRRSGMPGYEVLRRRAKRSRARRAGSPCAGSLFVHLLGEVIGRAELLDHGELRFQKVHVLFLVLEELFE